MEQDYIDWLYGLSAPMVILNKRYGASYTSPFFYPNDDFIDLKESWEIDSRETLLDCVFTMIDDGHAPLLSEFYSKYSQLSEFDWLSFYERQTDYHKVILKFVEQTFPICNIAGIRSWDYARMAYLLRLGTTNKYVTEEECLWILHRIGLRSTYFYQSWQHYLVSWFIGLQYWNNLQIKDDLEKLRCELSRSSNVTSMANLYEDKQAPFNRLPWFIDIEKFEKPESLREYDWL